MALSLKILVCSMSNNPQEAHLLFVDWLGLYFRIQKLIPSDDSLRCKFEEDIPIATSYILAAAMQYPSKVPSYHVRVLGMLLQLLDNVSEQTLLDTARLETENVFSLVKLIAFVSDFNAQMMAVRLLVKLLKYIDTQPNDLSKSSSPQEYMLYERILKLAAAVNYDEQNIYNEARDILNVYNMSSQKGCLVLSFSCKSMKLGEIEFSRETNSNRFWIDFNKNPRTLTCNCLAKTNETKLMFHSVSIQIKIGHIRLMPNNTLIIDFQEAATISGDIPEEQANALVGIRKALIKLDVSEMNRLKNNNQILNCYTTTESMSLESEFETSNSIDLAYNESIVQLLEEHSEATAETQMKAKTIYTNTKEKPLFQAGVPGISNGPRVTRSHSSKEAVMETNETRGPGTLKNITRAPVKNNSLQKTVTAGLRSNSVSEIKKKTKETRQLRQTALITTSLKNNFTHKTIAADSSIGSVSEISKKSEETTRLRKTSRRKYLAQKFVKTVAADSSNSSGSEIRKISETTRKSNQSPLKKTSQRKSLSQKGDAADPSNSFVSKMNEKSKKPTNPESNHMPSKNTSRQKTSTQKEIAVNPNNNSIISESKTTKRNRQEALFKVPAVVSTFDRRFFKSPRPSADPKPTQVPTIMQRGATRKRDAKASKALPPMQKQVNKGNLVNHLAMCDVDSRVAFKKNVENDECINITNESLPVYNDEQRQSIQNMSASSKRSTRGFHQSVESMNGRNIYDEENMSLSEAEPGISYRSFIAKSKKPKEVPKNQVRRSTRTRSTNGKKTVVLEVSKAETIAQTNCHEKSPVLPASIESSFGHPTTPKSSMKVTKPQANYLKKTYSNRRKVQEEGRTPQPPAFAEVNDGSFSSEIQCIRHEPIMDLTLFKTLSHSIQYRDDVFSKSPCRSPMETFESLQHMNASNELYELFETPENQIPTTQPLATTGLNDNNWHIQKFLSDHDHFEQQIPTPATPPKQSKIDSVVYQNQSSMIPDDENINRDSIELNRSDDVQQVTTVQASTSYMVSRKRRSYAPVESISSNDINAIPSVSTLGFRRALTQYQNIMLSKAEKIHKKVNQKCDDTFFDNVIDLTRRCCEEFHREQKQQQQTKAEIVKLVKLIESAFKSHEESTDCYKRRRFELNQELDDLVAFLTANNWEKLHKEAAEELQECSNCTRKEIWRKFVKARMDEMQKRMQSFLSL